MASGRLGRYERLILRSLSILYPILSVLYFFQKAWILGSFFVVAWFLVGVIGQTLNREKTFSELVKGTLPEEIDSEPKSNRKSELSQKEAMQIGKVSVRTSFIVVLSVMALLWHYEFKIYLIISIGVLVWFFFIIFSAILAINPKSVKSEYDESEHFCDRNKQTDWKTLLTNTDFKLAKFKIKEVVGAIDNSVGGRQNVIMENELDNALAHFVQTPSMSTAVELLNIAPEFASFFDIELE